MAKAPKTMDTAKTNDGAQQDDKAAAANEKPTEAAEQQPAAEPSPPAAVRYRVLAAVFVNGSLIEPQGRKDLYVHAAPGLEGPALALAPEAAAS